MSESISWNIAARAGGGPVVTAANSIKVDAYDKLAVTIPIGAVQDVKIAPGNWTSVLFVSLVPTPPDAKLTYKAHGVDIALDGSHFLVGAGAVSLLGTGAASLSVTNGAAVDVSIDILVGRAAS